MTVIDSAVLERHGIKPDEYERIQQLMGREPNLLELGLFSVMWSEHCSYKSSRVHLKTLPTTGPRVVQGPGENAGAVDIGDGLCAVFKIESHNHPSFIEPYQGAATGVGGIIRDIFTMGARPIALLNALRFGSLDTPLARRIFEGVVAGIGGYGNSIGIPTVGGEIVFDEMYAGNPLVNVLCLGIAHKDDIIKGAAKGTGNPVFYVGAKTGRDGIHGATMASAEFDEKSAEKRPAVQVGDPFMEKLLMEACLEVMKTGAVVGIQDMGAAGFTCSTSEMGSRGGVGMTVDVIHVPQRETGMTPYEIMLSESQERMLLVVERGREHEVEAVFEKWDLHAVKVGEVTEGTRLKIHERGTLVADVPNRALTDEAPVYQPADGSAALAEERPGTLARPSWRAPPSAQQAFDRLIAVPTIASKRWAYRQYDHTVGTNTIAQPGMSAAVVRVKDTSRGLAISVDGNGRFCYLDPYQGAMLAVAEASRNVACAGGEPIGATNNLNFGNPERPEIMWQIGEAVRGIGDACRALHVPITGGNVSLYNETEGRAIFPTPVLGVVGLLEDASKTVTRVFKTAGSAVVLLGDNLGELGGSEYLATMHNLVAGRAPVLDLKREAALQALDRQADPRRLHRVGARLFRRRPGDHARRVHLRHRRPWRQRRRHGSGCRRGPANAPDSQLSINATLFGESASRIVVSCSSRHLDTVVAAAKDAEVTAREIGRVGGETIRLSVNGQVAIESRVSDAERAWATAIENRMSRKAAS